MIKINKGLEPSELTRWKLDNPSGRYDDLTHIERQAIRHACAKEQFYLCAYCCQEISGENYDTMNEHVEAKSLASHRSLDFNNIVASCTTKKQCDDSHDSQPLFLTPLMDECEHELRYRISGRVEGTVERARETIRVLNLGDNESNNKGLIEKRKQAFLAILMLNGLDASEGLCDEDILAVLIDDLNQVQNGKLIPFAPVISKMLQEWMK